MSHCTYERLLETQHWELTDNLSAVRWNYLVGEFRCVRVCVGTLDIYVHVYVYVHMYHRYIDIYIHIYIYVHMHHCSIYIYIYMYMYICIIVLLANSGIFVCVHVCACMIYMKIFIYIIYVNTYPLCSEIIPLANSCVYVRIYINTYMCMYV